QARGQPYLICQPITMLYPRLGPYSLVSRRNQPPVSSCMLPPNIYLIVIFINERQQLWDERRDMVRRILYLNIEDALTVDVPEKAGKSYLQRTYSDIAISSCYLAKAEHHLGNNEQAWSWLKLAEKAGRQVPELSETFARVKQEPPESLN